MTTLALSTGGAMAMPFRAGLTECSYDGCRIVTMEDLTSTTRAARPAATRSVTFPSGPFDPHFTR
jgi:hypothetical protein